MSVSTGIVAFYHRFVASFDTPLGLSMRAEAQGIANALGAPMRAFPADLLGSLRQDGLTFGIPYLVSASVAGRLMHL